MRQLAMAVLAAFSLVAAVTSAPAVRADPPSPASLETLYARAESTGVAFTHAQQELERANQQLAQERKAARAAKADAANQSAVVAALTVHQLQNQAGTSPVLTLLGQDDPRELLARWSAYESTAEAMAARIDDLTARQTVHEVAERRLARSRERLQRAVAEASAARDVVNAALATSKRATLAASAERQKEADSSTTQMSPPASPATDPEETSVDVPPTPEPSPPSATPEPELPPDDDSDIAWDRIAKCESGGNWHINTGNGYYGGLQFSARTWRGVGGPGLPHEHSREVQIHYAKILQARYGWGQWSCANARFG